MSLFISVRNLTAAIPPSPSRIHNLVGFLDPVEVIALRQSAPGAESSIIEQAIAERRLSRRNTLTIVWRDYLPRIANGFRQLILQIFGETHGP